MKNQQSQKSQLLFWLFLMVAIVAIGFSITKEKKTTEIVFGAILSQTGSGADQAEWIKQGFEMALERSEAPIKIVYEDSKGDTQTALSAYKKLREQNHVPVVLTWGSGIGIALTPLVNQDKVIQMGVATAANAYSTPDDFTFRNFPRAELEAAFLADTILGKLKTREIAILRINNDYGKSSADSIKEKFVTGGGKVITEEVFAPNDSDFRTVLAKLKATSPKLIYLATYPKEGGLIIKQAKELGLTSLFIASVAVLGGNEFFNVAGQSAEGLMVATSIPVLSASSDAPTAAFIERYYETYGEVAGAQHIYVARAYDALNILVQAIESCQDNAECIKNHLFKVQNYHGVSGMLSFDKNGDVSAEFNLQQVKNGQFVPYEK